MIRETLILLTERAEKEVFNVSRKKGKQFKAFSEQQGDEVERQRI